MVVFVSTLVTPINLTIKEPMFDALDWQIPLIA